MRPDDFLRGLEDSVEALQQIRKQCPFIGYDKIQRQCKTSPIVSMSATIRSWRGSGTDTPAGGVSGLSAVELAETMVEEETRNLIDFMNVAKDAFGRELQYAKLWGALNMVLCMWLYRRLVLMQYSPKSPRIDKVLFKKCLLSVSAASDYQDWLEGRRLGERDRAPAYSRLKTIFAKRLELELGKKIHLPAPSWSNG